MYQSHVDGLRICRNVNDATEFQKYFLWIMAGQKIEYDLTISHKLTGIAKGVGVEFKKKR